MYLNVILSIIIVVNLPHCIKSVARGRTLHNGDMWHQHEFKHLQFLNELPVQPVDLIDTPKLKLGDTSYDGDELYPVRASSASSKDKGIISTMIDVVLRRKLLLYPPFHRGSISVDYNYDLPQPMWKNFPNLIESNEDIPTDLISLTSGNIKTYLDGSRFVWIVAFYSTINCTDCTKTVRMLETVAKKLPNNINVGVVNLGKEADLKRHYNIVKIPTIKIFYPGDNTGHSYNGTLTVDEITSVSSKKPTTAYVRIVPEFRILATPSFKKINNTPKSQKEPESDGFRTNWSDISSRWETDGTSKTLANYVLTLSFISMPILLYV